MTAGDERHRIGRYCSTDVLAIKRLWSRVKAEVKDFGQGLELLPEHDEAQYINNVRLGKGNHRKLPFWRIANT